MDRSRLTRFARISIVAAVLTIALKAAAYFITGSVGLLSDALESLVNLVAALAVLVALTVAARGPDEDHDYGHDKAEYFASGFEGMLILGAAASIIWTSIARLVRPQPIDEVGWGLVASVAASLINLGVALRLLRAARQYNSITLEADANHLLTDVWTSVGVVIGVGAVALTGWERLDPIIALAVAANIILTGVQLIRRSMLGLLDTTVSEGERVALQTVLDRYAKRGIQFHAVRTRQAGPHQFVSLHMLVPGHWTVRRGHEMLETVEGDIRGALPAASVFTHLEPLEDPVSWEDTVLYRGDGPSDGSDEQE
ncbi:MAG: cation diffusion facilitator family transporter [Chloroflexota bacterium]|nr:cation diffusion facilitator family transporter [Chloroflexota bacterium]